MIISCEQCSTRFQVPDDRITDAGVKARCSRCGHVFLVTKALAASAAASASEQAPSAGATPFSAAPIDRKTQPFPFGGGKVAPAGPVAPQNPFLKASPVAPVFGAPSDIAPNPLASSSSPFGALPRAPADMAPQPPAGHAARAGTPRDGMPRPVSPSTSTSGHLSASSFPRPSSTGMKKPFDAPAQPSDPFAAAAFPPPSSPSSMGDPFAASPGSPFAAAASPFGVPSTPSRFGPAAGAAGFDDGGPAGAPPPSMPADPFRVAPADGDPFSSGALGTPFGGQRAVDPFATTPPFDPAVAAQNAIADELFNDPSIISSRDAKSDELPFGFDTLGAGEEASGFIVPPSGEMPATSIHDVPDILREAARPEPVKAGPAKRRRKPLFLVLRPAVKPLASVANVVILVTFLITAVVVARGGQMRDVIDGRLVEILLGARGGLSSGDTLVVRDVVVARYPVPAARDLVVITGHVENTGETPVDGAVVHVSFGDGTRVFKGRAGARMTPLDVARANDVDALLAKASQAPGETVPPKGAVPFVVFASEIDDGARAVVTLADATAGAPGGS